MKAYSEYKDSGIDWLGEIPRHWECVKLKHLVSCNDEVLSENTSANAEIKYVEISDVSFEKGIDEYSLIHFGEAPSRARRITRPNDIIISTVRTYLKAIAKIEEPGLIVSTGFAVIRPIKIQSNFLYYSLASPGFLNEVENHSTGVGYPSITATDLINLSIPVPTKEEQEAIAAYLDDVVGKVDALVEEKRKQVEDLRSYRTSLITETVTRGLNPDVPLRPSGIDWLGDIPEHWVSTKAKYYIEIKSGDLIPKDDISADGSIPIFGGGEIIGFTTKANIPPQTIVIGRVGARCGCVRLTDMDSWATDNALVVTTNQNPKYSAKILEAANLNRLNESNAQPLITSTKIKDLGIPLPPISEQHAIAEFLDEKTGKIDALIGELEKQLEELAEYKKAVISEAVTGKVDVREWKPKN